MTAAYHHEDLRTALLDAAEATLQNDPQSELSLRQLAGKVGVSATAPYAHFRTKADVLAAVAMRGFDRLRLRTVEASVGLSDPGAILTALGKAYLAFSQENPGLYRVMFSMGIDLESQTDLRDAARRSYDVLRTAVRTAIPDLDAIEVERRTLAAWGLVHGFASLLVNGRLPTELGPLSISELARIAVDALLRSTGNSSNDAAGTAVGSHAPDD